MAKLDFLFCAVVWEATASVGIMHELADQAEQSISRAVSQSLEPGAVKISEYDDVITDENGRDYFITRDCYVYGPCADLYEEDVLQEYNYLISQLTRRSAFLTIFGLFEYHMKQCLELMLSLTNYSGKLNNGVIENTHTVLKKGIAGKGVQDVNHLIKLRNILAHENGAAVDYHLIKNKTCKKTGPENKLINAITRLARENSGVSVNDFNGVLMDDTFLTYAVNDINRYVKEMEQAIQAYWKIKTETQPTTVWTQT